MSKVIARIERCKACGLCIRECPKKAISMTNNINAKGYTTIQIENEKCINCGVCYWVCPDCVFELEVQ